MNPASVSQRHSRLSTGPSPLSKQGEIKPENVPRSQLVQEDINDGADLRGEGLIRDIESVFFSGGVTRRTTAYQDSIESRCRGSKTASGILRKLEGQEKSSFWKMVGGYAVATAAAAGGVALGIASGPVTIGVGALALGTIVAGATGRFFQEDRAEAKALIDKTERYADLATERLNQELPEDAPNGSLAAQLTAVEKRGFKLVPENHSDSQSWAVNAYETFENGNGTVAIVAGNLPVARVEHAGAIPLALDSTRAKMVENELLPRMQRPKAKSGLDETKLAQTTSLISDKAGDLGLEQKGKIFTGLLDGIGEAIKDGHRPTAGEQTELALDAYEGLKRGAPEQLSEAADILLKVLKRTKARDVRETIQDVSIWSYKGADTLIGNLQKEAER